jgi:beta-mannosidase
VPYTTASVLLAAVAILAATIPVSSRPAFPRPPSGPLVRELSANWQFRQAGKPDWRPATVPGSVHTDLLANELIPDPFYRDNEAKLQWIGHEDWEYRTTFAVDAATLARERVELVFLGLDTYATVYLNDAEILSADNMFRTWRVDAKKGLKAGENALRIVFRSPIEEILPKMKAMSYELPASNDQGEKTSPHTRKAPYQYGWDWGPRFVTSGVWQPVRLEAWDAARISDVYVTTKSATKDAAELAALVTVEAAAPGDATIAIEGDGIGKGVSKKVTLAVGKNEFALPLRVAKPRLWWPNGLGAQPLYTLRARLESPRASDERSVRVGIRTLELRQRPDEWGKSFEIVVNGVPVFAKGGNWIPADSFPERVTPDRYRHLLDSCRRANMNMVRVWGGGIYEKDEFYDMCDEMGLLVWQDFMFACSMYPGDPAFLENVREEAIDNVTRLRNHPSIALWCGNNEVETAWMHWGWKDKLPASLWDDYKKIFHGVLPEVCAKYDPSRAYWPSSPSSNLEEDADSQKMGDVHYWGVWHASLPFKEYEKQNPRFMSEYGFQSFPLKETVATYTTAADWDIESPVMKAHQRHPRGNTLIREYMLREYVEPKDFESFLYVSQVLQADGIRVGAEHNRRMMPRTMGSLYWQVDDCWPVASWSSMDYYGRWKALQFYAKRFFADVLLSSTETNGTVAYTIVSDRQAPERATLRLRLLDFTGKTLDERKEEVEVAPLASRTVATVPIAEMAAKGDPHASFLYGELLVGGRVVSSSSFFFKPFKELAIPTPKIETSVGGKTGAVKITVSSSALARAVFLSLDGGETRSAEWPTVRFSDNFFDVLPGEKVELLVEAPGLTAADVRKRLRVRSLADAFPPSSVAAK